MSGMFIRLEKPYPPGTTLALDLKLGQDFPLIQGTGEVVWTRERAEGPDRPAGVGIRFRDISEQSRDLTYAIVERRMADGGELFRLEGPQQVESQELPDLQELLQAAGKRRLREETKELEPLEPSTSSGELQLDDGLLGGDLPDADLADADLPDVDAELDDLELLSLPSEDVGPDELEAAAIELDVPVPVAAGNAQEAGQLAGFELDDLPDVQLDELPSEALSVDVPGTEDAGVELSTPRPEVTEPSPPEPSSEHPLIQGVLAQDDSAIETEIPQAPPEAWHGRPESDEEALDTAPPQSTQMASLDMAVAGVPDALDAFEPVEAAEDWLEPGQPLGDTHPPPPRSVTDSFPTVENDGPAERPSGVDLDELFRVAPSAGGSSLPSRQTSAVAVSSDDDSERSFKPLLLAALVLVVVAAGYYYMAQVGMVPDFGLLGEAPQQAQNQQSSQPTQPPPATSQGQDPAQASPGTEAPAGGTSPAASDANPGAGTSTADANPSGTQPASPAVTPPPVTPPSATPSSSAVVQVLGINWQEDGELTRITVFTDVPLPRSRVQQTHLDSPPRELVRLVGIGAPFDRTSIDVATPQVRRIRSGYHEKTNGNELHLVIDLVSPSARLDRIEANGRELVIWIGG